MNAMLMIHLTTAARALAAATAVTVQIGGQTFDTFELLVQEGRVVLDAWNRPYSGDLLTAEDFADALVNELCRPGVAGLPVFVQAPGSEPRPLTALDGGVLRA